MTAIRVYDPGRDAAAVRALFVTLHETERAIDPRMRPSEAIADAYLAKVFERARAFDGVLFVAERAGRVVGYVSVWRRYVSDELDDPPGEMGYVSDLVVDPDVRGEGLGPALLRRAEESVREAGVTTLRLSVLAGNQRALALYENEGFAPVELDLEKRLDDAGGREAKRARRSARPG